MAKTVKTTPTDALGAVARREIAKAIEMTLRNFDGTPATMTPTSRRNSWGQTIH